MQERDIVHVLTEASPSMPVRGRVVAIHGEKLATVEFLTGEINTFSQNDISVEDNTPIPFDFEHSLCPMHGEIFRKRWPAGYLPFSVKIMEHIIQGVYPELVEEVEGDARRIPEALKRKPACCRIDRKLLGEIVLFADSVSHFLVEQVCTYCHRRGLGQEMMYKNHWGRVKVVNHVCVNCYLKLMPVMGMKY